MHVVFERESQQPDLGRLAIFAQEALESFRAEKSSEYSFLGEKVGLAFCFFRTNAKSEILKPQKTVEGIAVKKEKK